MFKILEHLNFTPYFLTGAVFLGCVSSFFIMFGFGTALVMAKRRDPVHFGKVRQLYALFIFNIN